MNNFHMKISRFTVFKILNEISIVLLIQLRTYASEQQFPLELYLANSKIVNSLKFDVNKIITYIG